MAKRAKTAPRGQVSAAVRRSNKPLPPETAASAAAPGTCNGKTLCGLLTIGPEWLRQLVKMGYIEKIGRDLYRTVQAVQGYIRYLRDETRKQTKTAAASLVQAARAKEIERRLAREERLLIETDECLACCDEIVGAYNSELSGLAASVTRDAGLRTKIETKVDEICRRVADRFAQRASDLRASGEAGAPPDADDAGSVGSGEPEISGDGGTSGST